jgi:hypothetical protein
MGLNNLGNLDDLRGGDLNGPNYSSQESSAAPEQQNDEAAPLQGEASLSQQTGPAAQDITTDLGEAAAAASSVLSLQAALPLTFSSTRRRLRRSAQR